MSDRAEKTVEALRASLKEIERLRQQNRDLVSAAREPIAIVGMGCRLPGGVTDPAGLWQLVVEGRDAIGGFPVNRGWDEIPDAPDTPAYARQGGFVHDADAFDAGLFGISPREAVAMDPQQRLILESAWETVERAGIDPLALRGSRTGVFVGASASWYGAGAAAKETEGHLLTGTANSVISGRIAYTLGLEGPAVTIDTACSSSLVALHLAAQALRQGECTLAVVGGVTVIPGPAVFAEFARQGGLAGDGRCKSFAAGADGTGWSEGAAVLVVERLSDARRLGHEVLAVVRGSAVNQDGASNGLTAPNGPAQERVIRQALAAARLVPDDIDVVEGHGTGTTLGDPIEAHALHLTYGRGRATGRSLWLGSLKSNIGHTQAASGIAGVIKMVMAIRHGELPRTLHAGVPDPNIGWAPGGVELLTEARPWPVTGQPRRAAVSSFGISGTNAHAVIEEAPPVERPVAEAVTTPRIVPIPLAAGSDAALRAQAGRLRGLLTAEPSVDLVSLGLATATTRAALEHRAVVLAGDRAAALDALDALADGRPDANLVREAVHTGRTAILFTGQGAQRPGMGRALAEAFPVFADAFDGIVERFDGLRAALDSDEIHQTVHSQAGLFAFEVALHRLLASWGISPDFLLGHSIGEIVAAHVAGVLDLDDAVTLVAARGRLMQALPAGGAMLAVRASEESVREAIAGTGVDVAAVNGPTSVVLSGPVEAIDELAPRFAKATRLTVSHAFHSALMEPMLAAFTAEIQGISYAAPRIPVVSNLTGEPVAEFTADHWVRHVREAVRFADGIGWLRAQGTTRFLEAGPDAVLTAMTRLCLDGAPTVVTPAARRDHDEVHTLLGAAGRLHAHGAALDWRAMFADWGGTPIELPTYPFQREHYWLGAAPAGVADLRHRVTWAPVDLGPGTLDGTWLLAGEDEEIAAALRLGGATVSPFAVGDEPDRTELAARLRALGDIAGIVVAGAPDTSVIALLAAARDAEVTGRLWCVTRGAVAAGPDDAVADPDAARLWGLGRVAALEAPDRWGGLVDLDGDATDRLAGVLAQNGEDQVALRACGPLGRRLVPAGEPGPGAAWQPRGTVLVTGGTGGLGGHVARWLAERGTPHIMLLSRRGADAPGVAERVAALTAYGSRVSVVACDVADGDALAAALAEVPADLPVTGVIHTAGAIDATALDQVTPAGYAAVLRAKVDGAAHLDRLLADADLDVFVLFSSISGIWGSGGQAAYSAANAYLDALAARRRHQGRAATAVAWGPWAGDGMITADDAESYLRRRGLRPLAPRRAIAALAHAVDHDDCQIVVADVDWDRFQPAFVAGRPSALFPHRPAAPDTAPRASADDALRRRLRAADEAERLRLVLVLVRTEVATVLGYADPAAVEPNRPFKALGFDSLTAVELRDRLNTATGLTLPASLVYDYPSPATLAAHLTAEILGAAGGPAVTVVEQTAGSDDPIAIVGISCRYAGDIRTPEDLWRLVAAGGDGMSEFPADRGWDLAGLYHPDPDHSGTSYTRHGGFIGDIADFDAGMFGISPREALAMDPQQRLLLETSWEAFERARIDPTSLHGSRTGVFIGSNSQDYLALLVAGDGDAEGYLATGSAASVVSGRVAYAFGLEGPAVTVDTACSSSLVAIHLAAQALRSGECTLALTGGVALMSTPTIFTEFSRQRGLAADGRCKAFADAADGTGWGEGVGLLLLERLSDAERAGHEVLAVLRSSAINSDGASNGLTAPNGPSQQRVIRQALANARLQPADVDVVEAHGTGTRLGDPIEAQALLATYGQDRDEPLWLGSIKSNIGHTQAASGVAGIIKMVMALRHHTLPATLHVDAPSSKVDWSTGAVRLVTEPRQWPAEAGRVRRAGVSSFGMSGTNAHVIVEEAPAPAPAPAPAAAATTAAGPATVPWILSARSTAALAGQAGKLAEFAAGRPDLDVAAVARALATTRASLAHRAVVVGGTADELVAELATVPAGPPAADGDGAVVLVFPGQGSQWLGMAAALLDESPVFAARIAECAAALHPYVDWNLLDVLRSDDDGWMSRVDVVQPVLWAVMVSLAAVWQSLGVATAGVVGHSQGEIAAAVVAGILTLPDGARVVAVRSQALRAIAGTGGMLAVAADPDTAATLTEDVAGVSVAATNGPASVVLSGDSAGIEEVAARCADRGVWCRRVPVDYASHSAHVDSLRAELLAAFDGLAPRAGTVPFHSTVTGGPVEGAELDAAYWFENLRRPVRFDEVVTGLIEAGHRLFVEASPHPVLTAGIDERGGAATGSLRRDAGGMAQLIRSAGDLWQRGGRVDWPALTGDGPAGELPTYAFDRQRFWPAVTVRSGDAAAIGLTEVRHPLLGAGVVLADGDGLVLSGRWTLATLPWFADHAVAGRIVVPGTAFVELAWQACLAVGAAAVRDLSLHAPLALTADGGVSVQVRVGAPEADGDRTVRVFSRAGGDNPLDDGDDWVCHASGVLGAAGHAATEEPETWPPSGAVAVDVDGFYRAGVEAGYGYGPAFRGLRRAWRAGDDVYAEVELPESVTPGAYGVHPALLDAALHGIGLGAPTGAGSGPMLPFSWSGVRLFARGASMLRVRLTPADGGGVAVRLADATGAPVASIDRLVLRAWDGTPAADAGTRAALLRVDWSPLRDAVAVDVPAEVWRVDAPDPAVALTRAQGWLASSVDGVLVVVLPGAVPAGGTVVDPYAAGVWGLLRSAQSENPGRIVLVDGDGEDGFLRGLAGLGEPQVAVRGSELWVPRLVRALPSSSLVVPDAPAWRLDVVGGSSLDCLALVPDGDALAPLAAGQVRVSMRAAGVNFRDVLMALGLYPEPARMGSEGAGVVLEVAPDVTGIAAGDRVFGSFVGAFGPVAVTDHRLLSPMPAGWSFAQAASVSTAFVTAFFGLRDVAGLRAGERLLVHAGAGGVGMAAVRLARAWGVEVFATASPAKWEVLRGLGLDDAHIASSRDTGFEAKFGAVDVVLNSLAGEFIDASLRMLGAGGRFVEMGKADIRDADEPAARGVAYSVFDLTRIGVDRIAAIQAEVVELVERDAVALLPLRAWDVRDAAEAFRFMSQGRHVGKIVLTIPSAPSGTVLLTGGTGVLGGLFAEHLVAAHGVRDLVLLSRRGPAAPGAEDLVARLRETGAEVRVVAVDVADRAALAEVLDGIEDLSGVVHLAGVLDDGAFEGLSAERVASVWAGKAVAAAHLDELTRDRDLAWFVVFSSASATFGTAGQAAYASANAFLDGLVARRRAEGLPGLSLGWGLWAALSEMTSHLSGRAVARIGGVLSSGLGVALFDEALRLPSPHVVPISLDLSGYRAGDVEVPALLRKLVRPALRQANTARAEAGSLPAKLAGMTPAAQHGLLLDLVTTNAAAVLGYGTADTMGADQAFKALGFDSLTSVELRNRLRATTGVLLPATLVFDYPSPAALAGFLRERLTGAGGPVARLRTPAVGVGNDPIVVVGMGCRLPGGVSSPEQLWDVVAGGRDAITGFPQDRGWDLANLYDPDPDRPGTTYVREGGFVDAAADFDARLFGISPREALAMDPQQRLLLEVSWEALERAGISPDSLRGSPTGVFVGAASSNYGVGVELPDEVEGHLLTGAATSIMSGRVAYQFGLEGPAVTIDTACSSSLVALHLAVQALRAGECDLALAGGVTVLTNPGIFTLFARQRGLAADGRCKPFAAAADGTSMAEGAGVLVVERLSDAQRLGHRILAVVRGSAVNSDGASNGLTAPNGPAQQRVITQALANADLAPTDVDVVEAHGTGTALGDPIEAQALLATYGQDRDRPLWLGSVKSNIGHTQAAAGVAGIIKMVMALRHHTLPASLHVDQPTPQVDWSTGSVRLLTEARPWDGADDRPRRFAVSSFGISGTNAHAILEAPPVEAVPSAPEPVDRPVVWTVHGRTEAALRAQAANLRELLADGPAPADVAVSLATTRARLAHRAAVVASDVPGFLTGLADIESGRAGGAATAGKTAFLFTGQGAQRVGMGAGLAERFPVFAAAFDGIVARFDGLREALDSDAIHQTVHTQAGLFAVEVALFRLLESWGTTPDFLLGHSIGEIAAAHVAGVLSLPDAVTLVAARGRLMQALPAGGAMLAVQASEESVRETITGTGVDIAAVNGPTSVVVSGPVEAIDELAPRFAKTTRLTVSHAFHSSLMEPMLAEFAAAIEPVTFGTPRLPVVSNLTGQPIEEFTADYWVRHVRETVRFADGVEWLAAHGVSRCVEIGPAAVLTTMARDVAPTLTSTPALRKDAEEDRTVLQALADLHVAGHDVDWAAVTAHPGGTVVDLPTYAFQHERFWLDPGRRPASALDAESGDAGFWDAVEREDLTGLAGVLDATDDLLRPVVPVLSSWRRRSRAATTADGWRMRAGWQPFDALPAGHLTGVWLLVAPEDVDPSGVRDALETAGATVRLATGPDRLGNHPELTGVLALTGPADAPDPRHPAVPAGIGVTLDLIRALADADIAAPLWCVTRGAVSVGRSDPLRRPAQAQFWGLGRVAALELPQRWGGLIDLPDTLDAKAGERLAAALAQRTEDQIAVRASGVFGRRITAAPVSRPATPWQPRGTTVITGGTGALGAEVARLLAARGAPHLLLTSRRGIDAPGARALQTELVTLGSRVTVAAVDVADRDALVAVLDGIAPDVPVHAVVHAAGVAPSLDLAHTDTAGYADVVTGKVLGAVHLDALLTEADLDRFVVFSSIAGIWGSGGQAAYAAANAHLDALAAARAARGAPATAVAWGPWAEIGLASDDVAADHLRRRGLRAMRPALAMTAFARAVDHGDTELVVADVDWPRFTDAFTAGRPSRLFDGLVAPHAATPAASEPGARRELPALLDLVRMRAAAVLGFADATEITPATAFHDLGFDSLTAVDLRNALQRELSLPLPSSLVFDHPSPEALARHLHDLLGGVPSEVIVPVSAPVAGDDIVIVGMACRYPGGVESPEDLWRLVADGVDGTSGFPIDRGWQVPARTPYAQTGGFVHTAAQFDAGLFGISPREAVAMDPQQRLLLEVSWETLERCGLDPRSLRGRPVGVFVGASHSGYTADGADGHALTGTANSVISGRVSYSFGFEGPAMTVDTACSSSLVALHLAAQALRSGECDLALAGGVTVITGPEVFAEFARQDGLSSDGRCRSFAGGADGTGWGEGVGMLLVERRGDAERLGHRVLAVIAGSAINQDGASNGLTAPNGPAQQRVIRQALASAGLTSADVDVVEAHGTGTKLGDPIEAQALLATYGQDRERPLWLGSIKSNIGHTQAAAGVAGIIKMVMAMRHGVLPATLHVDEPSPHVDWSAGAVELLTAAQPWRARERARRAAVSAFGISGTNAHLILAEPAVVEAAEAEGPPVSAVSAQGLAEQPVVEGPLPWLVSARSAEALAGQVRRLHDVVAAEPELDAAAVAWSLATGRAALEHRAVVLAGARADFLAGLRAPAVSGVVSEGGLAFLFTGQGAQRVGMGVGLAARFPVFAAAFDAICARFDMVLDVPLRDAIDSEAIHRTVYTQAGLFAVEVALFRLVESWGITPDYLLGHSIGEIAAAHVADVIDLDDAVSLVALRGVLMQGLPAGGAMLAVQGTEESVREIIAGAGVDIAAVNGPTSIVISGPAHAIDELASRFAKATRLTVSHAFHSSLMEPMLAEFASVAAEIDYARPRIPVVSNLTGEPVEEFTSEYWVRHVREAVRFGDGMQWLAGHGVTRCLEVGPAGVLSALAAPDLTYAAALRRDRDEAATVLDAVAKLWTVGVPVDWTAILPAAPRVDLPTYAFHHKHYWAEPVTACRHHGDRPAENDTWHHHVTWQPIDLARTALAGRWLVVTADGTDPADVTAALTRAGAEPARLPLTSGDDRYSIADRLLDEAFDGVVVLPGPGDDSVLVTTALLQALGDVESDAPLWCLTRGAVSVAASEPLTDVAAAQVWGLGQVAALELPHRWGGLVDLPPALDERAADRLVATLARRDESQVAIRPAGAFARRLDRAPGTGADFVPPDGPVLITGGTGALGAHVARWLAEAGVGRLVLSSRRGLDAPGAADLLAELTALGAEATVAACDVTDEAALRELVAAQPWRGVVHAAGILDDGVLESLTPERITEVARVKVGTARLLDELTGDLSMFVLFSSVAGTIGSPGQANYAAANAGLDALARDRQARGLPATSIAWGPWADGGMAGGDAVGRRLSRGGLAPMDPARAMAAFASAVAEGTPAVLVADADWPVMATGRTDRLLDVLAPVSRQDAAGTAVAAGISPAELRRVVCESTALVLGHGSAADIDPDRAFRDLGLDSLTGVELRNLLTRATAMPLPATLVFDHPTPAALADHLREQLTGTAGAPAEPAGGPERDGDDPIVIVGMSCRFPGGVTNPDELWQLLLAGGDGLSGFPTDRGWGAGLPVGVGGFVEDATAFDAELFGVSPREALAMDPQQRVLLESVWEAFERAGIDPGSLRGSRTGVFAGTNGQDYTGVVLGSGDPLVDGFVSTGNAAAVLSGRIAYTFGLEGPAMTVDTACSSSLVALHLAMQALRAGECSLAVVGGVTVMSTPGAFVEFARQDGLAAEGRCKAFAAAADGTGWAEGAGVLVVERLSDARRQGHQILAVVRGSAINQDGASNGLTAPNGPSQQRVIRQALVSAGLTPSDVDAVEAHGTGTKLGDPIEAQALIAAYGQDRDHPLWLGSIKSNIGHTQAAAGVAGVIKMVLALRHGVLPPTLHVDAPTPHVDWSAGSVELLTEARDWPAGDRPRRAGVSSFGLSGTNAHTILEAYEEEPADVEIPAGPVAWLLSAKTPAGVRDQAARLGAQPDQDVFRVGHDLALGRRALEHRAVVIGTHPDDFRAGLGALERDEPAGNLVRGAATRGGLAFLFSGQGSQRPHMGRGLYERHPVYAAAFDAVCARFDGLLDTPLREVVLGGSELIHRTDHTQAGLFAVEVALFRLLESWGVTPDHLLGHSIGEIVAAHVAGALSLDDAVTVVAARGRLMQALPAGGAMLAVQATEAEVRDVLTRYADRVGIAAINGPTAVVVSGSAEAIDELAPRFAKTTRLNVSHAFHSPLMEPMLAEFASAIADVAYQAPRIPVLSNLTNEPVESFSTGYWVRHVREAVRFADGVGHLAGAGVTRFAEVGPSGVLAGMVQSCLADRDGAFTLAPMLRGDRDEATAVLQATAALHVAGVDVDWAAVFGGHRGRLADLPTYPFQRQRFWPEVSPAARPAAASPTDAWRYAPAWQRIDPPATPRLAGNWLVVTAGGDAEDVVAALGAAGADPAELVLDADVDRRELAEQLADRPEPAGMLCVFDGPDAATRLTTLLQALDDADVLTPLWCLTRGAVSVAAVEPLGDPAQAQLWGLGRVAALEFPRRWGGLVDVPAALTARDADRLAAALTVAGEDQIAVRPAGVLVRRLRPAAAPVAATPYQPRGTILVTGGTGALGAQTARWLAARGAEHLLLVSRRGPDAPGAADLVAELAGLGARATVSACDVADPAALAELLATVSDLTGVVHAAGVNGLTGLADVTPAEFAEVLHGKVAGAVNLDAQTRDLDLFLVFSSISGVWGSGGQGAYAAGNAFLDALVRSRRDRGQKGTAIAWGPWAGSGMAADPEAEEYLRGRGLAALDPTAAMAALERAVDGGDVEVTVADVSWERFAETFTAGRPSALFADLLAGERPVDAPRANAGLRERLLPLPRGEQAEELLTLVRREVAAVLGHATIATVPGGRAFKELGFDSLTAVELRNRLKAATGAELPASLVFDHPSPAAVATLLHDLVVGAPESAVEPFLAQLDHLEAAGVELDGVARARIAMRLNAFLSRWNTGRPVETVETTPDELMSASDDELIDFIKQQLDQA
ncbi:type I polyketide synthase [Micromonospora sp. NPDC049282]|uniref:type I polyketide synthase n=1 Tax=Micromonospora sp. NPDC049282 TaxID=3364269 RepID=UPI0037159D2E